jgi:hypothetical protein
MLRNDADFCSQVLDSQGHHENAMLQRFARLDARAFYLSLRTSIHLPASVEMIGKSCFCVCRSLAPIIFQLGLRVSRLEFRVYSSSVLASIHLPASVAVINDECRYGCHSLDPHPLERNQFTSAVHRQLIFMQDASLAPYRRMYGRC